MGLWVPFDIEILDDPPFVALAAADPAHPWRWMRVVQFAKRANEKGRVLRADGRPVTTRDLALAHDRTTATEGTWQDLVARCLDEGLLVEEDGALCVRDWRRWHRKPSDYPEATAERKARSRRGDPSRDVTPGHACHASEHSRAEHSRAEHSRAEHSIAETEQQQQQSIRAHAREGLAAAADVAIAPDADLGPTPEPLYTGRPGPTSLDALRPAIGQAMQDLGLMGAPSGTWWTSVTSWAGPSVEGGATLDDIRDALRYGAAKAAHDRPRRPWPYAMAIAAEEIGQIARRNQMRRDWEAGGRRGPEPLPYVWAPEEETCSR
jgi:hypothetical protein